MAHYDTAAPCARYATNGPAPRAGPDGLPCEELQMTLTLVRAIVFLLLLATAYELGWESGTAQLVAREMEFSS